SLMQDSLLFSFLGSGLNQPANGRSGQFPFSETGVPGDASTLATRSRFAIRRVSRATSSPASSSVKSRSTSRLPRSKAACVRQAPLCDLRQCDAAAAPIGRVRRALNQPVPLHAGEYLCHRRLPDLGEAGEITLRACPAILKRDQHWQMSNAEAKRLEPRFAEAGGTPRPAAAQWRPGGSAPVPHPASLLRGKEVRGDSTP